MDLGHLYYSQKVHGVHPMVDSLAFLRHIWNGTGRLTCILETQWYYKMYLVNLCASCEHI